MGLLDGLAARARPHGWTSVRAYRSQFLLVVTIAVATFWLAYDHGAFDVVARNPFAIGVWWAVLFGFLIGVWPLAPVPREAIIAGCFLAALAAWTLASTAWAPSRETALTEFDLAALYLGVFVLTVVGSRPATIERWVDGLALAIVAIAVLALASRLVPGLGLHDDVATTIPNARSRLSYPIGYWNGLAALAALGVPLLLGISRAGNRPVLVRSLALAGVPLLAATIYLTSSRGGAVAAAVAAVVFLALSDRRWGALAALAIAGLGSMVAVIVLADRSALTKGATGSVAQAQGRSAALLVAAACVGTAVAYAGALRYKRHRVSPPAWMGWAVVAIAALGLIGTLAASHPLRRFDHFRAPPFTSNVDATGHLLSSAGSGRWQFWSAAGSQFVHHPILGGGAGSFGRWWDRHGSFAYTTQYAHSLLLGTLGELGVVGFLLLLGVFVTALLAIVRRTGKAQRRQAVVPALVAAAVAYSASAAIDWTWALPGVTTVAIVVLGLLVGPATTSAVRPIGEGRPSSRSRFALASVALVLGWLVICAEALPLLTHLKINQSQAAVRRADLEAALADARAARALEPWAAEPYLQLALVEEQSGDVPTALAHIHRALARDGTDWRLWLVAARLQMKSGQIDDAKASVTRVRQLNPRSPALASLYRFLSP